jgi:hypothetical protein
MPALYYEELRADNMIIFQMFPDRSRELREGIRRYFRDLRIRVRETEILLGRD